MKKLISITTSVLLLICFSTLSAHAGAARRHTIEGFMLGTGVAILSAALFNGNRRPSRSNYTPDYARNDEVCYSGYGQGYRNRHHRQYRHHGPRGHWEIDRTWVEPVYEKKWNPGHYDRGGDWISGRNERFMVRDGYWQEERVWVRY